MDSLQIQMIGGKEGKKAKALKILSAQIRNCFKQYGKISKSNISNNVNSACTVFLVT